MEKNIAILMADLSGYTALTETHGSSAAADIIDKYMGIAVNITSRIAAKANAGTYWCSEEFVNALSDKSVFTSKGNHFFKNIKNEKEIFEICIEGRKAF
jgi:class 3 adenylate cyclase